MPAPRRSASRSVCLTDSPTIERSPAIASEAIPFMHCAHPEKGFCSLITRFVSFSRRGRHLDQGRRTTLSPPRTPAPELPCGRRPYANRTGKGYGCMLPCRRYSCAPRPATIDEQPPDGLHVLGVRIHAAGRVGHHPKARGVGRRRPTVPIGVPSLFRAPHVDDGGCVIRGGRVADDFRHEIEYEVPVRL